MLPVRKQNERQEISLCTAERLNEKTGKPESYKDKVAKFVLVLAHGVHGSLQ
jgi:hypothetical protein